MNRQHLFCRVLQAFRILLRYAVQHVASHHAIARTYTRDTVDGDPMGAFAKQLRILPRGSIYEVTLGYQANDHFILTAQWLATYGWNSNGHLIAIGRMTYIIFDPKRHLVILEDHPENGPYTIETYHEA